MSNLRSAQKRMTRNLLLESGLRVFREKGYSAATVDEIASGAGATRTTFYLHFSSKEALAGALIEQITDKTVASNAPHLPQVIEVGDREMLRTWLSERFDQWPDTMPSVMIADQAVGAEPKIARLIEEWHDNAVAEMVEGLDAAGRFAPEERKLRALLAFAQLEYLSRRWARLGWGHGVERAEALEALTDSLYRQLVTEAG